MPKLPKAELKKNNPSSAVTSVHLSATQPQAKEPDSVAYQHSLLCALTLPRSVQRTREYVREFQGRSLKLQAGELWDGKEWIPQPLPYGPKARLAFMHVCFFESR